MGEEQTCSRNLNEMGKQSFSFSELMMLQYNSILPQKIQRSFYFSYFKKGKALTHLGSRLLIPGGNVTVLPGGMRFQGCK